MTPALIPEWINAAPGNSKTTISWQNVSGAISYNLYWNTTGSPTKLDQKIANVSSPFVHSGRVNGTAYYYVVSTNSSLGESNVSQQASNIATNVTSLSLPVNGIGFHSYPTNRTYDVYVQNSVIYAATPAGLAISQDGGKSFQTRTTSNGLSSNVVKRVYVNGPDVYAITEKGLSMSTNGGNLFTGFFNEYPVRAVYVSGSTLYVGTSNGLYKYIHNGTSFIKSTWDPRAFGSVTSIYGAGSNIYVGSDLGILISTNGGVSWFVKNRATSGLSSDSVIDVFAQGSKVFAVTKEGLSISSDGGISFSMAPISISPDQTFSVSGVGTEVYVATYIGVFFSNDSGNTFVQKSSGTYTRMFATGSMVYGASYSGLETFSNIGNSYKFINSTSGLLVTDEVSGVYAAGPNIIVTTDNGIFMSSDGGTSFTSRMRTPLRQLFIDGSSIYTHTSYILYLSTDGGYNYTPLINYQPELYILSVFAKGSNIYVATSTGLLISTDRGATFVKKTSLNGLGSNWVYTVYANGSTIYAGTDIGLSISTDGGNTFINKQFVAFGGLVFKIFISGSTLYLNTYNGAFVSYNGGGTFTQIRSGGIDNYPVYLLNVVGSTLYATNSNGQLVVSYDGGASFAQLQEPSGIVSGQTRGIFLDYDKAYTFGVAGTVSVTDLPLQLQNPTVNPSPSPSPSPVPAITPTPSPSPSPSPVTRTMTIFSDGKVVCKDGYWRDDFGNQCSCNGSPGNIWPSCTWTYTNPPAFMKFYVSGTTQIRINGVYKLLPLHHFECSGVTQQVYKEGTEWYAYLSMAQSWNCGAYY